MQVANPPYPRALNYHKFCETKEDFNRVYGLSLCGIDPVILIDRMIIDVDWLLAYILRRVKGTIKIKHVHLELYEDIMALHKKLHH